jgi:poly-gamma-glutamate synthesis protein (capsule biosynthesis protein)
MFCLVAVSSSTVTAIWFSPDADAHPPAPLVASVAVSETATTTLPPVAGPGELNPIEINQESELPATTTTIAPTTTSSSTTSTTLPATTTTTQAPVFKSSVSKIDEGLKKEMVEYGIWRAGAPVALKDLRIIRLTHWDFDGKIQTGSIIVNQAWATQITKVFKTLFDAHFPIRRMDALDKARRTSEGIGAYDNTEGFQARTVNGGWSMHAYGLAVDINPAENPWVRSGKTPVPSLGAKFADRSLDAKGMVGRSNCVVKKAFAAIGWKWGGDWRSSKDYMHFSATGR